MSAERKIVLSRAFEKSFQKFTSRNGALKSAISATLFMLQNNAFDPKLRTHKLSGKLAAYLACSCGYDCRIIFTIQKDVSDAHKEVIVLLDIGTHDEVY